MTNTEITRIEKKERDRAIVMGGSIAGLAAARVLSDHFREVVLVERDRLGAVGEDEDRAVLLQLGIKA
jgi:heterodisulfide reductase subunit A-like polyferredoxin